MTALALDRKIDQFDVDTVLPRRYNRPVAAATTIYGGALVGIDTSGYANPAGATPSFKILGVAVKQVVNTVAAGFGGAGDLSVEIQTGAYFFDQAGTAFTEASFGALVYAVDDHTVSLSDGGGQYPAVGQFQGLASNIRGDASSQVLVLIGQASLYATNPETAPTSVAGEARAVATSALAAYAAVAGVITASANGALGSVFDGVTIVAGDTVLLPAGIAAAVADAGPYVVTSLGGASAKFVLTRPDWWANGGYVRQSGEIKIYQGTVFAGTTWKSWVTTATVVIGTSDPLLYPKRVSQSLTLVAGTKTITNVPIRSATLTSVQINRTKGDTCTLTVGGYHPTTGGNTGMTAGALGTGQVIIEACVGAGTISVADVSIVTVVIEN